ncbi:MAG TPA: Hpt domain-containing protein [Terracidiphilus sp.]|jgi:HPt (histidine-containing phosphotransfer) domain-containing protein
MESPNKIAQPDLVIALDRLWAKFLPEVRERVTIVESAVESLDAGSLHPDQREAAHAAAHKLAGVLGTFNLERGTVLARELEMVFTDHPDPDSSPRLREMTAELHSVIESRK